MRKLLAAMAVMILTATGAGAGDLALPPYAPPLCGPQPCGPPPPPPCGFPCQPPPCWCWAGFYGGVNVGFQWGTLSNSGAKPSGINGGFQGGYNWQFGQFVTGFETDIQLSDANDVFAGYKFSNPWFGTLRGRGGWALNNVLFYGTLGLAYGRGQVDLGGLTETNLQLGWTAGFGLEVGVVPNWSVKAEYLFIDLASASFPLTTHTTNGLTTNVARIGVNFHY
jgi:outer membrane immunogenic protein